MVHGEKGIALIWLDTSGPKAYQPTLIPFQGKPHLLASYESQTTHHSEFYTHSFTDGRLVGIKHNQRLLLFDRKGYVRSTRKTVCQSSI